MSKASDYMEKYQDAERLRQFFRYEKMVVREDEEYTSFRAELTGDGFVVITTIGQWQKEIIIKTDLDGAKEFAKWIWRIVKED